MKILIVEDDFTRIKMFKSWLIGFDYDVCEDADPAIEKVNNEKYDLIFLDHDLGGRVFVDSNDKNTGYQVAKAIVNSINKDSFVIIHSLNPVGAEKMANILPNSMKRQFGTFYMYKSDEGKLVIENKLKIK